jgi:hypothetical protein
MKPTSFLTNWNRLKIGCALVVFISIFLDQWKEKNMTNDEGAAIFLAETQGCTGRGVLVGK